METIGGKENEFTQDGGNTGKYRDFSGLDVTVDVPSRARTMSRSRGQSFMMGQGMVSNFDRSGGLGTGALEEDHNIIDDIVKSPSRPAGSGPTQFQPVGSFIDEKIRQMQQSKTSGGSKNRAEEFKSVDMATRQKQTRAVYNNKVAEYESSSKHLLEKHPQGNPNTPLAKLNKTMPTQHTASDPVLNNIFARDDLRLNQSHSGVGRPESAKSPKPGKKTSQRPKSAGGAGRNKKTSKSANFNQFNPAQLF